MQAHIIPITIDAFGPASITLLPNTDYGASARRVTRVATLDGGAVYNDFGHAEADRTITLKWTYTAALAASVERILRYYSEVYVSTRLGLFRAALSKHETQQNISTLTLLILERLSAE
jgi:hypothetical protein